MIVKLQNALKEVNILNKPAHWFNRARHKRDLEWPFYARIVAACMRSTDLAHARQYVYVTIERNGEKPDPN